MKALTLHRPWPWAIFHGGIWAKRIENRDWKPWPSIIGKFIVIHAGLRLDHEAVVEVLTKTHLMPKTEAGISALEPHIEATGLIGIARVKGFIDRIEDAAEGQERWWVGDYGWVLSDVRAFPAPIPCRGGQGLWNVPAPIEALVRAALR